MGKCKWFLRCVNKATQMVPHPILKEVPTCDKCAAFVKKMDEETSNR